MNDGRARFAFTDLVDAAARRAKADGIRWAARMVELERDRTPDGWARLAEDLHKFATVIEEDE